MSVLSEELGRPLHTIPLVQCQCGNVLRDAACRTLGCPGGHVAEDVRGRCGVCRGGPQETLRDGRGERD